MGTWIRGGRGVVAVVLLAVLLGGCARETDLGPLRLEVPDGWTLTRTGNTIKLTDGSLGDPTGTEPGSATAVFDIFLESDHTPETYRELLEDNDVGAAEERLTIDGHEAIGFEYAGAAFAGRQYAVVIPTYRIHIVYRAAFPNDDAAYQAGMSGLRRTLRSIRFTEPPPT